MKLYAKEHISEDCVNSNGTVRGTKLFQLADETAFGIINDKFTKYRENLAVVTNYADMKFITPAYRYGFIEGYAEVKDCNPARINISIKLMFRKPKDIDWVECVTGTFSFTCINRDTGTLKRLSKEDINEIQS
jgi:acyl-CoA thioesterase FadM